jgi:hypothetical protein
MREHENVWAKLSGAERLFASGPPEYGDLIPRSATTNDPRHRLLVANPARLCW